METNLLSTLQIGDVENDFPQLLLASQSLFAHLSHECVRGSYSAMVPRSSLGGVHREFVHHIAEDEVDGQEERQDDKREKMDNKEKSRRVRNMSA